MVEVVYRERREKMGKHGIANLRYSGEIEEKESQGKDGKRCSYSETSE